MATAATISVDIEAQLGRLEAGLRMAEAKVRTSAERMGRSSQVEMVADRGGLDKALQGAIFIDTKAIDESIGKVEERINTFTKSAEEKTQRIFGDKFIKSAVKAFGAVHTVAAGFDLVTAAIHASSGDLEKVDEILRGLPFGVGRVYGSYTSFLKVAIETLHPVEETRKHLEAMAVEIEKSQANYRNGTRLIEDQNKALEDARRHTEQQLKLVGQEGLNREVQELLNKQQELAANAEAEVNQIKMTVEAESQRVVLIDKVNKKLSEQMKINSALIDQMDEQIRIQKMASEIETLADQSQPLEMTLSDGFDITGQLQERPKPLTDLLIPPRTQKEIEASVKSQLDDVFAFEKDIETLSGLHLREIEKSIGVNEFQSVVPRRSFGPDFMAGGLVLGGGSSNDEAKDRKQMVKDLKAIANNTKPKRNMPYSADGQ